MKIKIKKSNNKKRDLLRCLNNLKIEGISITRQAQEENFVYYKKFVKKVKGKIKKKKRKKVKRKKVKRIP